MLGADDPLPGRPSRILVAGSSGSGKTTMAAAIGTVLQIRHIEIDAMFHGPQWTPRPSFETDVRTFAATPSWVTEWQYGSVRELLADRAELLVWLDLGRATVMHQVIRRTLARRVRGVELWNGNHEPPLRTIFTDPEHIVRWAWSSHARGRQRVIELERGRPDLTIVRLRSHRESSRWRAGPLRDVGPGSAGSRPEGAPPPDA